MSRPLQIPVQEKSKRFPSLNMNASFNPAAGRGGARAAPAGTLAPLSLRGLPRRRAHARRLFCCAAPGRFGQAMPGGRGRRGRRPLLTASHRVNAS